MQINLAVILNSKSEYREEMKIILENLAENSKQEEACLQYDLHQNIEDINVFLLHEVWKSKKGLDLHNEQSYLLEFIQKTDLFLEEKPTIFKTSRIG